MMIYVFPSRHKVDVENWKTYPGNRHLYKLWGKCVNVCNRVFVFSSSNNIFLFILFETRLVNIIVLPVYTRVSEGRIKNADSRFCFWHFYA